MRYTKIGIVNYGGGNIFSLKSALNRANIAYDMVNQVEDFQEYSHIIIPGVGHAGNCMEKLKKSKLDAALSLLQQPVLGICVGMQLLTQHSMEGNADLTNIIPLKTKKFEAQGDLKIPHMGWNTVNFSENPLFSEIAQNSHFYFVHSYYVEWDNQFSIAKTRHGTAFSAAIQYKNYYGVQFHPEKSGAAGQQLLTNFSKL